MTLKSLVENSLVIRNLNGMLSIYSYFFILFGFLGGNLFGCFFSILPLAEVFIIIILVFCLEVYSYLYYKSSGILSRKRITRIFQETKNVRHKKVPSLKIKRVNFLNFVKIGFLFGIFVDAFKVGS